MKFVRYTSKFLLLITSTAIATMSCSTPKPGDENYVAWVRDYQNGMHVRHQQNDLAFDLQFQPAEYVWMQRNGSFDPNAFEAQHTEFDQMQYFILNIYSRDGSQDVIKQRAQGDLQVANELLYYFSYRFQNDISLDHGSVRMPCTLFHYEQHGTKTFVLGFEKTKDMEGNATLTINSPILDSIPVKIKVSIDPKVL